jgi:hypothetical protein
MKSNCCNADIYGEVGTLRFVCSNCLETADCVTVCVPESKTQSARPLDSNTTINYSSRQLLDLRSRIVMEFIEKGSKAK